MDNDKKHIFNTFAWPAGFILSLWLIKLIEIIFDFKLTWLGIFPGKAEGLLGIITSIFIHGDLNHLISNTLPLFLLSLFLIYFYETSWTKIFFFIYIFGGILVWIFARPSYHIGASGIIYGLCSFYFFNGITRRDRKSLTLALLVLFLYNGLILGLFPVKEEISWEGHLFGALAGLIASFLFRKRDKEKKYDWEDEDLSDENPPEISYNKGYPFE